MAMLKKLPFFLPLAGCRGQCVYCDQRAITGVRAVPSPADVREALRGLAGPREICYFGGSFCRFAPQLIKEYLDCVTEHAPAGSTVRFSTYPGDLRDDALRGLVKKYPISRIELGIPTLDPAVLAACRREADPEKIFEDIKTLKADGLPIGVQMMIGLPGQDRESSLVGLRALAALKGAERDMRFGDLCDEVLSLSPFSSVTREDYRLLLKHMINKRTLIQTEDLTLLIGPKAEAVAFGRDFSAVFEVREETEIRAGGSTVGTVQGNPEPGTAVALAGRVWLVTRRGDGWAEAVETDGEADARWKSDPPDVHTRVMSKVRDVLLSDDNYPYLDSSAREELELSRRAFRVSRAGDVFVPTEDGFDVYPWLGTVQFDTLRRMLDRVPGVRVSYAYNPLVIGVSTRLTVKEIRSGLQSVREGDDPVSLLDDREPLRLEKYDRFVPEALLADAFCARRIDWDFEI